MVADEYFLRVRVNLTVAAKLPLHQLNDMAEKDKDVAFAEFEICVLPCYSSNCVGA